MLPLLLILAAQSDKLPPANPVPMAIDGDEGAAMAAVNALLRAIEKGDAAGVLAATRPEGIATVADEARTSKTTRWTDLAAGMKPTSSRIEERLGTPAIEVDGDIAMVWAPYTLFVNGRPHHCGYDHFDLTRANGAWKVLNVTWSQRMTGCGNP